MITVIYNEGHGFTEVRKVYSSLDEATKQEGKYIIDSHVYKNKKRIF